MIPEEEQQGLSRAQPLGLPLTSLLSRIMS